MLYIYIYIYIYIHIKAGDLLRPGPPSAAGGAGGEGQRVPRRRENMVGVNMVGVNMAFHDAVCERFEGAMLEPCLLKPCFHVAGFRSSPRTGSILSDFRGFDPSRILIFIW